MAYLIQCDQCGKTANSGVLSEAVRWIKMEPYRSNYSVVTPMTVPFPVLVCSGECAVKYLKAHMAWEEEDAGRG